MKFSALLLVAVVAAAKDQQSAPRLIDPSQHKRDGSRVWGGNALGFLTIVSIVPPSNLPLSDPGAFVPEEPQIINSEDGTTWWGFHILPPMADYSQAIFATSKDGRVWVSFNENEVPSLAAAPAGTAQPVGTAPAPAATPESKESGGGQEGLVDERIWKGYPTSNGVHVPVEDSSLNVPAQADTGAPVQPRIWWGYPEGDFGKGRAIAPADPSMSATEAVAVTAESPKPDQRIWWGYPEGDFGKYSLTLDTITSKPAASGKASIYWALPPKDATSVPEDVAIGHDATGRVWWGYIMNGGQSVAQGSDAGIASDRDGSQYRIWWGYPEGNGKNAAGQHEVPPVAVQQTLEKIVEAEMITTASQSPMPKGTEGKSLINALKKWLPVADKKDGAESTAHTSASTSVGGTIELPKNGEQAAIELSEIKKGELERRGRASALIEMVQAQNDDVLREELGAVAERLLDDLKEYQLNAAAAQNALGEGKQELPGTKAQEATKMVGADQDLAKRFDELQAKYEKLLAAASDRAH